MPIVRVNSADIDRTEIEALVRALPPATEEQIEAWALEDGGALTDAELAGMRMVYPPPTAQEVRAVRERLALDLPRFAHRFGFDADILRDYEEGRVVPSGPAATLLRVIAADPEAVERAISRPMPAPAVPLQSG